MKNSTRRDFIGNALGVSTAGVLAGCVSVGANGRFDVSLSVFISDLHVGGTNPSLDYAHEKLTRVVDEILALRPLPRRVVCGYVLFRTDAGGATRSLVQSDFFFQTPTAHAVRPRQWDVRTRDNQGKTMRFAFEGN